MKSANKSCVSQNSNKLLCVSYFSFHETQNGFRITDETQNGKINKPQ